MKAVKKIGGLLLTAALMFLVPVPRVLAEGPVDLSKCTVKVEAEGLTYDGKAKTPAVTVTSQGAAVASSQYHVSYQNNIHAGNASVTIQAAGSGATGKQTVSFSIGKGEQQITAKNVTKKKGAKNFSLKVSVKAPGGKAGALSFKSGNKKVAKINAAGRVDVNHVGSAQIRITAGGTQDLKKAVKTVTVTVIPKGVVLTSLRPIMGKSLTASWKRGSGVSGYELRYARTRSMKKAVTVEVPGASTRSKTLRNLKVGRTYYVQIRTYKIVKGTKYYSKWGRKLSGSPSSPKSGY